MNTVVIITVLGVIFLIAERIVLRRHSESIRYRIHVNGTRGKSGVARSIGAVLSSSRYSTVVKITGIVPTIFYSDGSAHSIRRRGRPRVQEQCSVISLAARQHADALVMECMSLKAEYQLLETRLFRPHVTVITNILDDHREEMGRTDEEQLQALAASIPFGGTVFTADLCHYKALKSFAVRRGSTVHYVPPLDPVCQAQLPPGMIPENVSIALAVAAHAGIERAEALRAIIAMPQDPLTSECSVNGHAVRFINGFAVNDVPSADRFLSLWSDGHSSKQKIIILNTRHDRPLRTAQFVHWCAEQADLQHVIITGTHIPFAHRLMRQRNVSPSRFTCLRTPKSFFDVLELVVTGPSDVYGFGNIAGDGFAVVEQFLNRTEGRFIRSQAR